MTSFTYHGTKYVFVGVADASLSLDADSALFAAICGGGSECTNAALVVLIETCLSEVKSTAVCLAREGQIRGLQVQQASVC